MKGPTCEPPGSSTRKIKPVREKNYYLLISTTGANGSSCRLRSAGPPGPWKRNRGETTGRGLEWKAGLIRSRAPTHLRPPENSLVFSSLRHTRSSLQPSSRGVFWYVCARVITVGARQHRLQNKSEVSVNVIGNVTFIQ